MLNKLYYEGDVCDIIEKLDERKEDIDKKVENVVKKILEDVREQGDEALMKYSKAFDGVEFSDISEIIASKEEIEKGAEAAGEDFLRILNRAKEQIIEFHKNQIEEPWFFQKENGVVMGQMIRPLKRVAVYVPGGTAIYPSTVLMNTIPAKLAGVEEVIILTPVKENGKIPDVIMAAAKVCGVDKIYKIGGAQAIAVATYGTKTIKKVDKIVGPGNIYVATAKKLVYGMVGIDMLAGPSEILVIADETANPKYVAADLMSQAEHDKLSSSILITTSEKLADEVNEEIKRQIENLYRKEIIEYSLKNFGLSIIVETLDEAFDISNEIAPEHLEVLTKEPMVELSKVENAGSIFLGENLPEPLGDYMSGTNHVLPTSRHSKI